MKNLLIALLLVAFDKAGLAQTVVQSIQTTNNDKVLAMNIVGQQAGRPFHHTIHFDVSGMTLAQRDSLYQETVQALGILGIKSVPGLTKWDTDTTGSWKTVTFNCETCTGKGRLEVFGNNITATRTIDPRQDGNHSFPLKLSLLPGDYRLMYYQKRVLQMQSTFLVKAGQENVVKVSN